MLRFKRAPLLRACGCGGALTTALHAEVVPFSSAPMEAINFLRDKVDMPTATWTDLWEAEHSAAFTVAGAQSDALVSDFHDAVSKAIESGETLDDFRKDFDDIVERYGWDYNGSRNWRSRVIFDTNMSTAYAAGRWDQIQQVKDQRPYLRYVHLEGQAHPRPLHEAWDGTILPVDHEWWLTHYPPNGWFCHCTVQSLSDDDLDRYGWSVSDDAPESPLVSAVIKTSDGGTRTVQVPEGIDPGFAYRPGAMPDAVDSGDD
jgi:uncharacterized protein with gpF-like domain